MINKHNEEFIECETCQGWGEVNYESKFSVDTGTKWKRNFEYNVLDECSECHGFGFILNRRA